VNDVSVDFTKVPAQSRAFQKLKPKHRVANAWGRGVGKSWFARVSMYLDVSHWEHQERQTEDGNAGGIRQVLLMPTLKQFKKVHEAGLDSELAPNGRWGFLGAKIDHTDWRISFPGGSWIQVVSAHNINEHRGLRCDKLVSDECDDIDWQSYDSVCVPWFSEPWSLDIRLVTGTPRRGRYGLLWREYSVWPNGGEWDGQIYDPQPLHYGFHATYKDAPLIVSRETVDEAKRKTSPDTFAREWLCDFDSGEGLVYPFFDVSFHVKRPPSFGEFHTFIVGADWGFVDPSVYLVIGVAGKGRDTVCHVIREEYMLGLSETERTARAKAIEFAYPGAIWYPDILPTQTKDLKAAGIRVAEVNKSAGSVEDGVAFVADSLFIRETDDGHRWAQLYVDPSCRHTIAEFGLYRRKRDPRNTERVLDDIDTSKDDHCMDALRYALHNHFGSPGRRLATH
jgi:Terminase RNAseH like domain